MDIMRTGRLLSRVSIVGAVLALGLVLLGRAPRDKVVVGQHDAAAVVAQGCGGTWIRGITENKTHVPIRVASTGERVGNKWCREPEDVRVHTTDAWLAGDKSGSTELQISYLLENGDRVLFLARVGRVGPTRVGCSFVEVVRTPREYECKAEDVASVPGIAAVRFTVLAVRR